MGKVFMKSLNKIIFEIAFCRIDPQKMNHNHTITNQPMILIGDGDDNPIILYHPSQNNDVLIHLSF